MPLAPAFVVPEQNATASYSDPLKRAKRGEGEVSQMLQRKKLCYLCSTVSDATELVRRPHGIKYRICVDREACMRRRM